MTDRLKEQLSAFLDGELPEAETTLLLKRLERDDDLKGALSRYSLIGAVMRADGVSPAGRHVAARVSAAIAREPELRERAGWRWQRPAAGLALAASVAMAAVLLLPQWMGGEAAAPEQLASAAVPSAAATSPVEPGPLASGVIPVVTASYDELAPTYTTPPAAAEPAGSLPSAQLASYLVAHSEYTLPLSRASLVTSMGKESKEPVPPEDKAAGAKSR